MRIRIICGVDPGGEVRRLISFESTNLMGSPQDDIEGTSKGNVKNPTRKIVVWGTSSIPLTR
jgi:hypothetical protein